MEERKNMGKGRGRSEGEEGWGGERGSREGRRGRDILATDIARVSREEVLSLLFIIYNIDISKISQTKNKNSIT